jgi:hypothetical protein
MTMPLFPLEWWPGAKVRCWLGAVDPARYKDYVEKGTRLPSLHSSEFYPLPEPAIRTGVKAMTTAVMALLKK